MTNSTSAEPGTPAQGSDACPLELARNAFAAFRSATERAERLIANGQMWPDRSKEIRGYQDGALMQAKTAALLSIAESLAALAGAVVNGPAREPVYSVSEAIRRAAAIRHGRQP